MCPHAKNRFQPLPLLRASPLGIGREPIFFPLSLCSTHSGPWLILVFCILGSPASSHILRGYKSSALCPSWRIFTNLLYTECHEQYIHPSSASLVNILRVSKNNNFTLLLDPVGLYTKSLVSTGLWPVHCMCSPTCQTSLPALPLLRTVPWASAMSQCLPLISNISPS